MSVESCVTHARFNAFFHLEGHANCPSKWADAALFENGPVSARRFADHIITSCIKNDKNVVYRQVLKRCKSIFYQRESIVLKRMRDGDAWKDCSCFIQ